MRFCFFCGVVYNRDMKKQVTHFVFVSVITLFAFIVPQITFAVATCPTNTKPVAGTCVPTSDHIKLTDQGVSEILFTVAEAFLAFLAALSILVITIAGIMYITSAGDESRIDNAKRWLLYAIIGLVIALLSYVIVYAVGQMLGVTS